MSYGIGYSWIKSHRTAVLLAVAAILACLAVSTPLSAKGNRAGLSVSGELTAMATPEPSRVTLSNGIRLTLYSANLLASRVETLDGQPIIRLDAQRYLAIIDSVDDPAIYNKGDGQFHPFPEEMVIGALEQIRHRSLRLEVTVYVLPFPRRNLLVSSTSGSELFLSPHVLDIHPAVGAYIVTHEAGHAFHNRFLPGDAPGWHEYRRIRDIENTVVFSDIASHAYRPREIFAEDFRVLFGGPDAVYGGNVENPELPSPLSVSGLESFMVALSTKPVTRVAEVAARSYPNPFNPETTIRVEVPVVPSGNESVSVSIYSVRGALVNELYFGSAPAGELEIHWNGTDRRGNPVASANYFARVRVGEATKTLKLVMLK